MSAPARPLARLPLGVESVFGPEARLRRGLERRVLDVFLGWSYEEVLLPAFDDAELFAAGLGRARAPRTHRFTDAEGSLLALRPEMTTLVARLAATRLRAEPLPLRLCYSGEVFRADAPERGRGGASHQLGVEHLGTDRLEADIEVLLVCVEALRALSIEGFRISLGHAGFLLGIAEALGLEPEAREALRAALDRRERAGIVEALAGRAEPARVAELARLATLAGGPEVLRDALRLVQNPASRAAAEDLALTLDTAGAAGLGDALVVDLGSVAGFDYYTGLTFQVWAPGVGAALGGGGRYDRLCAQLGRDLPAVGFSLWLEALARAVAGSPRAEAWQEAPPAEVLSGAALPELFRRAAAARAAGRTVRIETPAAPAGAPSEAAR